MKSEPLWKWIEKDFYLDVICSLNTSRNEVQIKDILLTYILLLGKYLLLKKLLTLVILSNTFEKVKNNLLTAYYARPITLK